MSASATTSNRHTTAILLTVPQLTRRRGNARVPAVGVAITFIGMAWLSRLSADTPYMTGLALPMVVLGIGQRSSLGPLTAAGIARVMTDDACAASGLVNVAHQLGGSLGLGILVTVFAAASSRTLTGSALPAHQVSAAQSAGLLALALVVVLAVILTPHRRACAHSTAGSCRDEQHHRMIEQESDMNAHEPGAPAWTPTDLATIDRTGEVKVATRRADGTLRTARIVWIVRHGDSLYVRSVNGREAAWYRGVQTCHAGVVTVGQVSHNVAFTEAGDHAGNETGLDNALDEAYRAKYGRSSGAVEHITAEQARATTLRLDPA